MGLINGTVNNDIIIGTPQNDGINLLAGNDLGFGLDGNDFIFGDEGIDILVGNRGDDTLIGGAGNDFLFGGQNSDVLFGASGNDSLIGNRGDDQLNGNTGDDAVYGGQGNDVVRGGQGNDAVFGDIGNDVLYGDLGNNSLTGGAGQDIFVVGVGTQTLIDFSNGSDRIGLASGVSFSNLTIAQGSGTRTVIRDTSGQIIATIQGVNADQIDSSDFTTSTTPIPVLSPAPTPIITPSPSPSPTPTPAPVGGPVTFTLQLLHTADQEAGLPAIEDAVNFSAVLNALADDFPNTLKLTSGDLYIPGPFFSTSAEIYQDGNGDGQGGIGDILINNALGFQAAALGNHEFDFGPGTVQTLIQADNTITTRAGIGANGYLGTQFPYLSSNLDFSTEATLSGLVVPSAQAPQPNSISKSVVLNVGGERVGVVGATTPTLGTISSPGGVGVNPANANDINALAAIIQQSVDELVAQGINKIVLLAHMQQISIEEQLAGLLNNVDIVMAGGSNTILANADDPLRAGDTSAGVYPKQFTSPSGEPVYVINTDGNYRYVGRLVAGFDANGIISQVLDESGAYATDAAGVNRVYGRTVNPQDVADPTVVAVTQAINGIATAKDSNLFGNTSVFLEGRRSQVRREETNLGSLTADANLIVARQTDPTVVASLKNGGGIRDNIGQAIIPPGGTGGLEFSPPPANPLANKQEGDVSQLDIENTLRFNNSLTIVPLTATQLKEIAEHGVSDTAAGNTPGRFPQISGMAFSFDASQAVNSRVRSLAIKDDQGNTVDVVVENGSIVGDASRTIKVATLGFLAGGGDGYPFPQGNQTPLPEATTGNATFTTDNREQDALAEHLAANYDTTSFNSAETPASGDTRIQDIARVAADTVLNGTSMGIAGDGNNTINGDGNANVLVGHSGVDNITGNGGNDIIAGGLGNDNLTGSTGDDVFVFAAPGDGSDTITDFGNGSDTIRVFASQFTGLTAGATPTLTQSATAVGTTAQFLYSGGILSFDSDGTGATAAQTLATLTGSPALAASQIIVL
ncbi:MAG: 5'-nucleotidase C-terminal domain-containing protein [Roseofilum sp. SBFL]|uniref:5'-nucleotidase C-terminal domain-containing protein n=1 Tax=unclassified Roseofilum TaxID=2620099 RepID=UPI001B07434F|nr:MULTISPECIES: 5'-nucleotidase C-terminal domain-containing protein [unclassified Roseofilum]MBP0013629.1 5'-nucleotidase C-terminal domain-containing protein [Roseofilum sp. SID3]MBP0025023.1 5'-nucleotidase C-terminal domain-containing protein [Roseofilum sp. SID2]MBP0037161.1 5'-nucleotidase C-terminal domain-containing protein [Roseofilum sp. SID1]MBP0040968.1 5'-nucleotidase C-terminal domain-containing protein [Roseofilum sp. SBFL]